MNYMTILIIDIFNVELNNLSKYLSLKTQKLMDIRGNQTVTNYKSLTQITTDNIDKG